MDKIKFTEMPTEHEARLYLTTIGEEEMLPGGSCGPKVRPYYVLHYVTKGCGRFFVNGMAYHLQAGQGFSSRLTTRRAMRRMVMSPGGTSGSVHLVRR